MQISGNSERLKRTNLSADSTGVASGLGADGAFLLRRPLLLCLRRLGRRRHKGYTVQGQGELGGIGIKLVGGRNKAGPSSLVYVHKTVQELFGNVEAVGRTPVTAGTLKRESPNQWPCSSPNQWSCSRFEICHQPRKHAFPLFYY